MSEDINKLWRRFFEGKYHTHIVDIIKPGMESFFSDLVKMGLLDRVPEDAISYQTFIHAQDITSVKKIFNMKMELKEIGECFPQQVVPKFRNKFRGEYQIQVNKQTEEILKLEQYDEFIKSIRVVTDARNFSVHNLQDRNDSGWALSVVASVFNLIELSPTKIDEDKESKLKSLALKLMDKIFEIENYDEENEDNNQSFKLSDKQHNQVIENKLEEFADEFSSQIDSIGEKISQIENLLQKPVKSIQRVDSNGNIIDEEYARFVEEETERVKNLSPAEYAEEFGDEDWLSAQFEEADQILEEAQRHRDRKQEKISKITVQQAERELLMLQKEIKKTYRCDNWANIAQGPFRQQIFQNKITNKEDWLSNDFIQARYARHSYVMDRQLNSEIAERYFAVLKRITWEDIF